MLSVRIVIKTWTEVAARVCLYMLTSDLTSPLAASEESRHRLFIYPFIYEETSQAY